MILPYDKTNPKSIEEYAKHLKGLTFYDVLSKNLSKEELEENKLCYDNPRGKGKLGNLLEKYYFYYEPNSESEPDFKEAGTELKVTPYEKLKNGKIKAGERLVIGMIPNKEPIEKDFMKSHLLKKMGLILLIFYLREKEKQRTNYNIDYITLFSILSKECEEDLSIIKEDYKKISEKIIAGKAHELSEGDTKYLGACTKGGTAEKSLQEQFYNKDILAKRRAFSLKQSYMTYVLNHYVLKNKVTYDSFIDNNKVKSNDFDVEVIKCIDKYKGKTEEEIYSIFNLVNKKAKQRNNMAICRMLGVKTDRIAEFEKADIKIKTIRVNKNGKPNESMSFPKMVIKDFVEETFEDSKVYNDFSEQRFLFVVFRENLNKEYVLSGAKLWNMPIMELETKGKEEWEMYRKKFKEGVNFKMKNTKKGYIITNDLPKKTDTEMFHLRPHSGKSAYLINGKRYGNGKEKDMDELLNGDKMTYQCFWLSDKYVKKIIKDI